MIDSRFYKCAGSLTLEDVLRLSEGTCDAVFSQGVSINNVATLAAAGAGMLAYIDQRKFVKILQETKASIVLVTPELREFVPSAVCAVVCAKPRRAFAKVSAALYPEQTAEPQVAPTARVHKTARLSPGCQISDYAVIGADVLIGEGTIIGSHVVIDAGVEIGQNCRIDPFVYIQKSIIGDHVRIQAGSQIGKAGFGYDMDAAGHLYVPQLGRVIIEDDVHIGANSTIDRGALADTIVGAGSRIDNLVQIAHNVVVGKNCVLVAQVGIAGSTELGNFVVAAGQVGIADHLKIGHGVRIAAQSGLIRDVEPGETIAGTPAVPVREWHRQTLAVQKLIKRT